MEVIRPGSSVVVDGDIRGTVIEINVVGEGLAVSYNVAWWSGRERKTEWVDASEVVEGSKRSRVRLGFTDEVDWGERKGN